MTQTPSGARLVEDPAEFRALLDQWKVEPIVALDTEAASFHRYLDRVYLLQVSTSRSTWIVDPLAIPGLPGMGELLADPGIEFVFHDADYDLRLLDHEYGFRVARLFDTRVAAQFVSEPAIGLAALLEKLFGVTLDKRFQRADWSLRPLSQEMLAYAALDTRYLAELRDTLRQQLRTMGRLSWVEEECGLLREVRWPEAKPPELAALDAKGARTLSPRGLAIFRELYVWRESLAEQRDRAPFRIAVNEALLWMAQHPVQSLEELRKVRGLGKDLVGQQSDSILSSIARALALPESELPRYPRPPRHRRDPAHEDRLDRLKAMRTTQSARLNLPPGLIAPNWLLESIARAAPANKQDLASLPGLRRWQLTVLGGAILDALK